MSSGLNLSAPHMVDILEKETDQRASIPVRLASAAIRAYQYIISPLFPSRCRYYPSCSNYALEALQKHGALKGSLLTAGRLARCHPWGGSGLDPVPDSFHLPHHHCCQRKN